MAPRRHACPARSCTIKNILVAGKFNGSGVLLLLFPYNKKPCRVAGFLKNPFGLFFHFYTAERPV